MNSHTNPQFHNTPVSTEAGSPWEKTKIRRFEDLILKPEFQARKLRFPFGETWCRLLPAMQPSTYDWMMGVHALNFEGGRFAHPRTLSPSAKSVYDQAFAWAKKHHPRSLYGRENRKGIRLLSDPLGLCWCITKEHGKQVARLILASGYNGSRGGDPGIAHRLWSALQRRDEEGNLLHEVLYPLAGRLVCVSKTRPKGATQSIYHVSVGQHPAPIHDLMASMEIDEIEALCPLENTIRQLSEEEEWQALSRLIAPSTVEVIKASLKG